MSDLGMYELEDISWDEFCRSDDHIVPRRTDSIPAKKIRNEESALLNNTAASKSRNTMLEQDSWSNTPDSSSIKEVSSSSGFKSNNTVSNGTLLSDKSTTLGNGNNSFSYALGDMNQRSNDIDLFENSEEKDPSDFLYYGWPEIGNFDDVDRMFRNCDTTFGLGPVKEDELGWISTADDIGGPGDLLKSYFKFPGPESNEVKDDTSENRESSKSYSIDSYMTFTNGSVITDSKDGFMPKEQIDHEHKKQSKHQNQTEGKRKKTYFQNGSFNVTTNPSNETMHISYGPTSHPSFPSSSDIYNYSQNTISFANSDQNQFPIKSETRDFKSASSQLKYSFRMDSIEGGEKKEKLQNRRSSINSPLRNSRAGKFSLSGDQFENHSDLEGLSSVIPSELVSSNVYGSPTMSSATDDISLEAASFRHLQLVTNQLDLRTKLCIRDSLYRLARSAEQRHDHGNMNTGDERIDSDGINKCTGFMDIETETNPIDRSIAHLLFHRPSDTSTPRTVQGSSSNPPAMVETSAESEKERL